MTRLISSFVLLAPLFAGPPDASAAKLRPETLKAWETYIQLTEKRIEAELNSTSRFLRSDFLKPAEATTVAGILKSGKVYVQKINTAGDDGRDVPFPGGMIHDWFGSIFVPGVRLESLLNWLKDYDQHHRYFKEVEISKLLSRDGDTFNIFIRLVRTKVVTVRLNTNHTVVYRHHRNGFESSRSFTTRIAELKNAGTSSEMENPVGDDGGFLWRLNSYWRFRPQDGGVVIECETISLSRSIPFGLAWLIRPFLESVPQESLESTLVSIRDSVSK